MVHFGLFAFEKTVARVHHDNNQQICADNTEPLLADAT